MCYLAMRDERWRVTGVDALQESLERCRRMAKQLGVEDRISLKRAKLLGTGQVRFFDEPQTVPFLEAFPPSSVHLLLISRYLPPRCLQPFLQLVLRPGGIVIFSTFVQDGNANTWRYAPDQQTENQDFRFSHPCNLNYILQRNECREQWFPGFEVLCDEIHSIEDGRPVLWFVARKE